MSQIYDSLKSIINPEMVSKASATLSEDHSKVSSAIAVILPTLLAKLLKEGNTPQIRGIVEEAGQNNLIGNVGQIFGGHGVINNMNIGERFENALLGVRDSDYYSAVAAKSGVTASNANRLTTWVAGLVAAFFGDKVVNQNRTMPSMLTDLDKEKNNLKADIPSKMFSILGLSSVLGMENKNMKSEPEPNKPKKKNGSMLWLLLLIILLLLLIFSWRSCNKRKISEPISALTEAVDTMRQRTTEAVRKMAHAIKDTTKVEKTELTLPSGAKMVVYKDGCENRLVDYLQSGKYKNATNAELQQTWYAFDNLDFEHNSATKLMDGSEVQVKNLGDILKEYPDVKISIAGFADKTGGKYINDKISEERANYIKSIFVKEGIDPQRISTEGFGERYATQAVSEPDKVRAVDRHFALRITR